MKLKVKRQFQYQTSATSIGLIEPGIYSVPGEISDELAEKILKWGRAEVVTEKQVIADKKAPENKLGKVSESKRKVAKPAVRGRSTRARSKR